MATLQDRGRAAVNERRRLLKSIEDLESQQGQVLSQVQKINADVVTGWNWLQDHKDEFEQEVFGPAVLCCTVKDERYADQIQGLLGNDDVLCFTTQTRSDHKKLSDIFYKDMGLGVTIRTCMADYSSFARPVSAERLTEYGLDGFAIDYLAGPRPVLAMMCAEKRLHASSVALRDISDAQYERIIKDEVVNSWSAGRTSYRVTRRREYGPGAISTSTRHVQQGVFWTNRPVDSEEKRRLMAQAEEIKRDVETMKEENNQLKEQKAGFQQREDDIRHKIVGGPTPERRPAAADILSRMKSREGRTNCKLSSTCGRPCRTRSVRSPAIASVDAC